MEHLSNKAMPSRIKEGPAWALFVLRLLLGSTFILHGLQKVFGLFGGPGLTGFARFAHDQMGMPVVLGYVAGLCELIGGGLVLLGVATELGALLIVPVMVVAIGVVHGANGYFAQQEGFEYAWNLLLVAIALLLGGPGKWAWWDPFRKWREAPITPA